MPSPPPTPPPWPSRFQATFRTIAPLILAEWPTVKQDALEATAGQVDQVIDCIATATGHTHTLIRRQLGELYQMAIAPQSQAPPPRLSDRVTQLLNEPWGDTNLQEAIAHLETQTEKLLQQMKQEMLPDLQEQVQKHPLKSVLTAVGIGFVLGLLVGGRRGR